MWLGIVLTIVFVLGFARIMVNSDAEQIRNNWAVYRCDPHVMMFAGMFKKSGDPRTDYQFASDNFEFCASEIAKNALTLALKPIMDVFYQMSNAAMQSIGFVMNLRTLSANLFNGLNRMFDIFNRRFNLTFHELHMSFLKQFTAIQRANAIATAAVFSGISLIRSILNFFKLMIIICISILVIMIVLVIFLWFIFAPVAPLILVTIGVIAATGSAAAVGGMADAFCFSKDTTIMMKDGFCPIKDVKIGDKLADGSTVTATMKFHCDGTEKVFILDGVVVSGSHLVYKDGKPIFVNECPSAEPFNGSINELYCLNTSSHIIPVLGSKDRIDFADWEEIGNDSMTGWDKFVRNFLNNDSESSLTSSTVLNSESGFAPFCSVKTPNGPVQISMLSLGDSIYDGENWTKVVGKVILDGEETEMTGKINNCHLSGASWIFESGKWIRAIESKQWRNDSPVNTLISIFTESGKLQVENTIARDFSDVGIKNISKTYNFTFSRLPHK